MTWRSPICSSFLDRGRSDKRFLALILLAAANLHAGGISGSIQLTASHESSVRKHGDFSGVVIWLELIGRTPAPLPSHRVRMIQKDKRFDPHVLAITVGSIVDFPNLDPIFHNAFSNFDGKVFDVGLYPPGSSRAIRFDRPGVVRIFCNIHQSMSAIIAVLNSPYFAITGKDGQFSIPDVPGGQYQLKVLHERATAETLDGLSRTVTVGASNLTLPVLTVSEAGYLPMTHRNKYGRDYRPDTGDGTGYSQTGR